VDIIVIYTERSKNNLGGNLMKNMIFKHYRSNGTEEKVVIPSSEIVERASFYDEVSNLAIFLEEDKVETSYDAYGNYGGDLYPMDAEYINLYNIDYIDEVPERLEELIEEYGEREGFVKYCKEIEKTVEEVGRELDIIQTPDEHMEPEKFYTHNDGSNFVTYCLEDNREGFEFEEEVEGAYERGEENVGTGLWKRVFITTDGRKIPVVYSQYSAKHFDYILEDCSY
jgi:hypothetical protein